MDVHTQIPTKADPCWGAMLSGSNDPKLTVLATKLMLQRLRGSVKKNPSSLPAAVAELHAFFTMNAFTHKDLALVGAGHS